jgi:Response regulator containing a CheY-like receiver domain and an HTH DNA-binding domain
MNQQRKVLSVGQCDLDSASLARFLDRYFRVAIERAALPEEAMERLRVERFDLVLINRKLDADYSDGREIVRSIKQDSELAETPVMLVSNHDEAQQEAVELGAEYGFGKLEYADPRVIERLKPFLS